MAHGLHLLLPVEIYSTYLKEIKGIKFTLREIDVLASIVQKRGTSKVASLLSISPHTVFTHTRNIMGKIGGHSREEIVDFVANSGKLSIFKIYYTSLLIEFSFRKALREAVKLRRRDDISQIILSCEEEDLKLALQKYLGSHLSKAGFKVFVKGEEKKEDLDQTNPMVSISLGTAGNTSSYSSSQSVILLGKGESYYSAAMKVLKEIVLELDVESLFKDVIEQHKKTDSSFLAEELKEKEEYNEQKFYFMKIFRKHKLSLGAISVFVGMSLFGFQMLKGNFSMAKGRECENTPEFLVRSDLSVPGETALLERPLELNQIEEALKAQSGIQVVALVGPGGAGKTTLARQYAQQEKSAVIWEMNGETPEALSHSFESLAEALATVRKDKKSLELIKDTSDFSERERQLIQFVKNHLKASACWCLIFDNVESPTDIQKYFPHDEEVWGKGKVILTTRDGNMHNPVGIER
jgi:DNA-binding CsgD family transcriptional regulator